MKKKTQGKVERKKTRQKERRKKRKKKKTRRKNPMKAVNRTILYREDTARSPFSSLTF